MKRWKQAQADGLEIRPVEYLNLAPLKELFETHLVGAAGDNRPNWDNNAQQTLTDLVLLRTSVAHSVIPILKEWNAQRLGTLLPQAEHVLILLRSFL